MSNEITEAVVEEVGKEAATEAIKQSWSVPEVAVLILAGVGAWTTGKFVGKKVKQGINSVMNWWTARKEVNEAYDSTEPVMDIKDCKEVVDEKKAKK